MDLVNCMKIYWGREHGQSHRYDRGKDFFLLCGKESRGKYKEREVKGDWKRKP